MGSQRVGWTFLTILCVVIETTRVARCASIDRVAPTLPSTLGTSVADTGQVAGYFPDPANSSIGTAFRWTPNAGTEVLPPAQRYAWSISNDGSVLVGVRDYEFTAAVWNEAQGWHSLPTQGAFQPRVATKSNHNGSVIVGYGQTGDLSGPSEPFRWTPSGGLERFGLLPGGRSWGFNGVSTDGSILGGDFESPEGPQAFRWTASEGILPVGDLPGGEFSSSAFDMSEDGTTIVGLSNSSIGDEGFIWTASRGIRTLGAGRSAATAVSGDGTVVVGQMLGAGGGAFVWTEQTGPRLLTSVLSDAGVTIPTEGLWSASSISSDGRLIACESGGRAYLITLNRSEIPEPGGGFILLALSIALTQSRYGRQR